MHSVVLGWLAGLFAVMAAMLALTAAVVGWPILLLAIPLAAVAYLFWYHATGRLTERLRQRARRQGGRRRSAGTRRDRRRRRAAATGFGPQNDPDGSGGTYWREERRRARERTAAERGRDRAEPWAPGPGHRGSEASGRRPGAQPSNAGMSPDRARGVLGVRSDADAETIRDAYREKVKETHPDRGGSTDAFKRVNEAYETLDRAA
ncbi:DnaJ domain-containing protein [Salinarchaeum sp. Harcht-Bsk1]|uniref:J domain-containing protein n=1 Tax=Salinarchaeum sp. Harcht-Bsk1 TaxID=1333523 RepID=UPI00034237A3|nr:J domain-containing protein [Salinarchaeum sp. Harcht-Bsk1]AGN02358.1 DnaJ domain-containing protein [Salinarchaeum sp. Harcht-Bsk1]